MKGRVAFVGGGGSGIGAACVRRLRDAGATVIAADLAGGDQTLDVTDEAAVRVAFADIERDHGLMTLAVNSVGVAGTGQAVADYDLAVWEHLHRVNLTGTLLCMREQLAQMARGGGGSIVNIASVLGLHGSPGNAAYASSKHALIGLTKSAAVENAPAGIRVNALCPGFIDTPLLRANAGDRIAAIEARHPVGRLGTADEVAAFALFLLSDDAAFVTGAAHLVDGGYSAI